MDLKKQILSALGLDKKEEELNLEFQAKLIDGTIVVSKADELAEGVEVMILAEDGSTMPVPVGTYETEDGVEFKVEKEGIVASMEKKETEEEEEEETEEKEEVEAVEEEMSEETVEKTEEVENKNFDKNALIEEIGVVIKELLEEVRSDVSRLSAELEEMKDINGELTTEKEELQSQIVELSKKPATKPVEVSKFNETKLNTKPYANMNSKERFYYNLNK